MPSRNEPENIFTGSFDRKFLFVPGSSFFTASDPPTWDEMRTGIVEFSNCRIVDSHVWFEIEIDMIMAGITTGVTVFDTEIAKKIKRKILYCTGGIRTVSENRRADGSGGLILDKVRLDLRFVVTHSHYLEVRSNFQTVHIKRGGSIELGRPM